MNINGHDLTTRDILLLATGNKRLANLAASGNTAPSRMKYEITLWKTVRETIHVEAENPEQAIKDARLHHPGMNANEATELSPDADGELEPGASFVVITDCENCDKLIFDVDEYVHCEDCDLCVACAKAISQS